MQTNRHARRMSVERREDNEKRARCMGRDSGWESVVGNQ